MGVVTNNRVAAGSLAGTFDYTLVSGPNGPHNAEIRHASGVTTPTAQFYPYITVSGFSLAGQGMGLVKPIKPEPATPGYRRHSHIMISLATVGAFMPRRGINLGPMGANAQFHDICLYPKMVLCGQAIFTSPKLS